MKKHSSPKSKKAYFEGDQDREFNIASMRKYLAEKPEIDKVLEQMIAPYMRGEPDVLDACCGIGHLIINLSERFPRANFLGIDETAYLVEEARALAAGKEQVRFETGDALELNTTHPKAFDLSICWKTLSWLPSYEEIMTALVGATRSHIFISSLFYDGDIDTEIFIREYAKERGKAGEKSRHNIYGYPRFERFMRSLGGTCRAVDFEIPIDLPRGDRDHMGTYTIPLADGRRLQMSGPLPMPWKIVHIVL